MTEDAIAFILKQKKASVSMLQRRFRIGYNRAASIIDEIEARGDYPARRTAASRARCSIQKKNITTRLIRRITEQRKRHMSKNFY